MRHVSVFVLLAAFVTCPACSCGPQPPSTDGGGGSSGVGGGAGATGGGPAGGAGGSGGACATQGNTCSTATQCCSGLTCQAGACQPDPASDCGLNATRCNGQCVVPLVDPNHCGGCGVICATGQVCTRGACVAGSSCLAGTVACSGSCVNPATDNAHCGGCPGTACAPGTGCSNGTCVATVPTDGGGPACAGGGPPIYVASDAGTQCTGNLAQVSFRWAICACEDVNITSGNFRSDAFDSTRRGDGGLGGSLGANRAFLADSHFDVGGSVWSGGTAGFANDANQCVIRQDLRSNGPASGSGSASVLNDAFVNGSVQTRLAIAGRLYTPGPVGMNVTADGGVVTGPAPLLPPCDCSPSQLIDVAGIVRNAATVNDNGQLGVAASAFENPPAPARLDLPCGRYYFTRITPGFAITIAVHGRTAIFLAGNLDTSRANVAITIDPQAELDIFVGGTIVNSTQLSLGNIEVPAQLRVYIAGSPVDMSAPSTIAGNFYLPYSAFSSPSNLDLYGSIFARSFEGQGVVHYDRGVLTAGSTCGLPPADAGNGCGSCRDCNNQACIAGRCGACGADTDCCAPLVCRSGTCVPIIN